SEGSAAATALVSARTAAHNERLRGTRPLTAARRGDQATGSPPVERAPRDAASRDELGLSLQGDGARTGEIAGAIHDGVERRRDAEDAHQRRVVRRPVADAGAAPR